MASYHLNVQVISRGKGQSITAAVAYASGERLRDYYEGRIHDRSCRQDILHKEILLPQNAPSEFLDRQTLVRELDASERYNNSQMARSIKIALPNELSLDENIALTKEFVAESFINIGLCADIAFHEGSLDKSRKPASIEAVHERQNNPHAHIIVPFREVDINGFHKTKTKGRYMNRPRYLNIWRKLWARLQNREFERRGLDVRVSHESLAAQGIMREATKHIGAGAMALELNDIRTDIGNEYRETLIRNKERELERELIRDRQRERERNRGRDKVRERDFERGR